MSIKRADSNAGNKGKKMLELNVLVVESKTKAFGILGLFNSGVCGL